MGYGYSSTQNEVPEPPPMVEHSHPTTVRRNEQKSTRQILKGAARKLFHIIETIVSKHDIRAFKSAGRERYFICFLR